MKNLYLRNLRKAFKITLGELYAIFGDDLIEVQQFMFTGYSNSLQISVRLKNNLSNKAWQSSQEKVKAAGYSVVPTRNPTILTVSKILSL